MCFAFFLILFPGTGALAVLTYISAYALSYGFMLLILAFRLKKLWDNSHEFNSRAV
jgi:hypothetical protein